MRTRRRPNEGQTLVEFALVIPIMLLFLLGIVDLGRGIYIYSVVSNVAREGARYAIVHGSLAPADGETASGPGTSDASGATYVVPAASALAFGLDRNKLKVGVCWGSGCTVPSDCSSGTSTANAPVPDVPVTVRACYDFQAITATLLPIPLIPLVAQATLVVTH